MKKIVLSMSLFLATCSLFAQSKEEIKKELGEKKATITTLEGEVSALQTKLDQFPGWKLGAFGTIGGSLSGFNDWFTNASPNNETGTIGVTLNAYANLDRDKYFWRNSLNLNLGWVKFDDLDDPTDENRFQTGTDIFNITSLYGYKLTEKFAVSTLAEYRTALLEGSFNDPGYLDIGIGGTWTPIQNLVVVIHPLNYNFVFADGNDDIFESSLGAKVVADYTRKLGSVSFKSNLSGFLSYEDTDLSSWQWTNGFSYTLWKKLGVGFDFGIRGNKQESLDFALTEGTTTSTDLSDIDTEIQTFYNIGLSYAF